MSKKSLIINLSIILVVTGLSVYFLVTKNVINAETVKYLSFFSIFAVFAFKYLSLFGESLVNYLTVKNSLSGWTLFRSFSERLYGNLGSDVSPFKSAHYPLRLYYYAKKNYGFFQSLSALTKCQILASFSSVINYAILSLVSGILGYTVTVQGTTVGLFAIVLIGLGFHALTLTLCLMLAFIKPFQTFMISLVAKIKYGKRKPIECAKFCETQAVKYSVYKEQVLIMLKEFWRYLLPTFIYILNMFITSSLIYVSYVCVTNSALDFKTFFIFYLLTICTTYITNVIPIPGGSGSSEVVFSLVFAKVIPESTIGAVLVVWRFGSYYIPVIIGVLFFIISSIIIDKRKMNKVKAEG